VPAEPRPQESLESPDVAIRPVLAAALGAGLLLAGTIGGLDAIWHRAVPIRTVPPPQSFPEPQVRTDERAQRLQLEARQRERLNGYHWADQPHSLVQIPIERAMQIIAQEGAQAYAPLVPSPQALSSSTAAAQRAATSGQPGSRMGAPDGGAGPAAPAAAPPSQSSEGGR
jgi:hypothetical protein